MRVRDLRDSAWRTFGRWLTNKSWSQLSSAESCKDKFHIFITELQNAVDAYLPWKTVRIHPTDRPWTTKSQLKSGKLHSSETGETLLPIGFWGSREQQLVVIVTTCGPATTIEILFKLIGVVAGPSVQVPLFHSLVNMWICKWLFKIFLLFLL